MACYLPFYIAVGRPQALWAPKYHDVPSRLIQLSSPQQRTETAAGTIKYCAYQTSHVLTFHSLRGIASRPVLMRDISLFCGHRRKKHTLAVSFSGAETVWDAVGVHRTSQSQPVFEFGVLTVFIPRQVQ